MSRFGSRLGWVLVGALCCALVAVPAYAAEPEESGSSKDSKKQTKESPLVKASREVEAKKTGTAQTYGNDDLKDSQPAEKVYTNDDLARMYGSSQETEGAASTSETAPAAGTPEQMPDPLALMEQQKTDQATREKEIAQAEAELAAARERLKNLEVQLLATRNPFSARPELNEEEQEARATTQETAAERNARTQKMVDEAKVAVTEAEAKLARARSQ